MSCTFFGFRDIRGGRTCPLFLVSFVGRQPAQDASEPLEPGAPPHRTVAGRPISGLPGVRTAPGIGFTIRESSIPLFLSLFRPSLRVVFAMPAIRRRPMRRTVSVRGFVPLSRSPFPALHSLHFTSRFPLRLCRTAGTCDRPLKIAGPFVASRCRKDSVRHSRREQEEAGAPSDAGPFCGQDTAPDALTAKSSPTVRGRR